MSNPIKKITEGMSNDFNQLCIEISALISKETGNILDEKSQEMVRSRLGKRLVDLKGMTTHDYRNYLKKNKSEEIKILVGLLTTHHTFFFREFLHFEFLLEELPRLVQRAKDRKDHTIYVYSAACSRGHEVYSLGMFFHHHLKNHPEISVKIVGTDVDEESIKIAQNGVYPYKEVISIPRIYLEGNWQRGTGTISTFAKIKDTVKAHCFFTQENLMNPPIGIHTKKYDLIFCRNAFIYFNQETIEKICLRFKEMIQPDGILITGVSESLKGTKLNLQTLGISIYRFSTGQLSIVPKQKELKSTLQPMKREIKKLRVFCVDDSASVLKLLTKIFQEDPSFILVGTASNGIEAQEFIKNNQTAIDVMTLDIHMPQMDGVEYLKLNFNSNHPPVVVVSSASREDTIFAQKTLSYGASDFVEKPALNNLAQRADEIKNKLKMAFLNKNSIVPLTQEKIFSQDFIIQNPDKKIQLIIANFSEIKKIKSFLGSLVGARPPIAIFFEGNEGFLALIREELSPHCLLPVCLPEDQVEINLLPNQIYIFDFQKSFHKIKKNSENKSCSISIFGLCTRQVELALIEMKNVQILIEDLPDLLETQKKLATDIFPWTSFSHVSTEYLSQY